MRNLEAFSEDFADKSRANSKFKPFKPAAVHITECFGWTHLQGHIVTELYQKTPQLPNLNFTRPFFAIVYAFVPEGILQDDVILSSYELFYLAGFFVRWQEDNWRGPGILVDHCDMLRPDEPAWPQPDYGKRVKVAGGGFTPERHLLRVHNESCPPPRRRPKVHLKNPSLPPRVGPPPPKGFITVPPPSDCVYVVEQSEAPKPLVGRFPPQQAFKT